MQTDKDELDWLIYSFIDRYGFAPDVFSGMVIFRQSRKRYFMRSRILVTGVRPLCISSGIPFARARLRVPKLTTVAAMKLAPLAKRNVLALNEGQCQNYYQREVFEITVNQLSCEDSPGYVLLTHRNLGVGLGYREGLKVASLIPKGWL